MAFGRHAGPFWVVTAIVCPEKKAKKKNNKKVKFIYIIPARYAVVDSIRRSSPLLACFVHQHLGLVFPIGLSTCVTLFGPVYK
jgi:hypothetical protein